MTTLLIAEHNGLELTSATLSALTAARQLGGDITLLVAGDNAQAAAEQGAQCDGVSKVLLAQDASLAHDLAENLSALIMAIADGFSHIMAPANSVSKETLPRVAALLDVGQLSDITAVLSDDQFQRPIYAGNAIATVTSHDAVKVITVRAAAFDKASLSRGTASIETVEVPADTALSSWVNDELTESERPELTAAERIVSGGRGVGSGENFALLEALADKLGAAVGASRAAVDSGFVANDMQVGQTGKIVAPDLYMAFGISGAIQHLAGMKDSKVIVAVNKDEDAPIFQVADYGLVADLFDVLPELTEKL
ncbi:electron transfer flavoprotein subunit alpha/FixB family protein [Marinomonas ostreistagni]|uniref:electron transfer flavoprotein subunit alpha/FixB family protein n=1 Tax=Marinomonas ostreistagni TaxID=359209 RepID=UPI0019525D26|nr:FAD-binding protein [Marinomonas ostreistagni]MBM6551529.1 FAD-binding protein [Marinomonas ostreistagni]